MMATSRFTNSGNLRFTNLSLRSPMLFSKTIRTAALSGLLLSGLAGSTSALAVQGSEHHKLLSGNGQAGDQFGSAIATDGTLVVVGAGSDSAYVFGALLGFQNLELLPSGIAPSFGAAVAVDGDCAVVGAPFAGGVGPGSGVVYVFDTTTGLQLLELEAPDAEQFGTAVAMDEGLIVVGALNAAYLFDAETGQQLEELVPDEGTPVGGSGVAVIDGGFGESVDIEAGLIVVGAKTANGFSLFSGAAYVFDTSGNELSKLSAGPAWSQFGGSVGIGDGTVVIGAKFASPNGKDSGQAYLFDAFTGNLITNLVPSDGHIFAHFGSSVGIDGPHVIVGAEQDNEGGFSSGALYVYEAQSGSPIAKLLASDAAPGDELGTAVAVARGVLVAGAPRDDDNGDASGSAYTFDAAGTVTDMAGCFGNAGALDHVSGIAVAGQPLVLQMDSAQPEAALALLFASGAPVAGWPNCGLNLGSAGELLIDITPPTLFRTWAAPWTGLPVDFSLAVPPVSGLTGLQVYFQGAFVDPISLAEPVRLTQGLEVMFGGYL